MRFTRSSDPGVERRYWDIQSARQLKIERVVALELVSKSRIDHLDRDAGVKDEAPRDHDGIARRQGNLGHSFRMEKSLCA